MDERLSRPAKRIADSDLVVAEAFVQQIDGEHLGVVVVVGDFGGGEGFGRERPVAGLAVGDRNTGDVPDPAGEQTVAEPSMGEHSADAAVEPAADDVVSPSGHDRFDHGGQLGRIVLPVGVAEDPGGGAGPTAVLDPGANGGSQPPVDRM